MNKASSYCPQCVVKDKELESLRADLASEQRWASQYKQELEAEMQAHAATIQREAKVSLELEAAAQRIREFDACIRRIATKLGSPACGGVDTAIDDPHGTTAVLIGRIEALIGRIEALEKKLAEQQAKLIKYVDPEHLLQKPDCCDEGVDGSGECCGNGACSWKAKNLFVGGSEELTKLLAAERKKERDTVMKELSKAYPSIAQTTAQEKPL